MKALGKHVTADLYGCPILWLNDLEYIKESIYKAAEAVNLPVLELTHHQLEPQGITVLAILADSHLSIHTYPELSYAAVDILTFSNQILPEKAINTLKSRFKPEKVKCTTLRRGDFGSVKDMKPSVKVSIAPLRRVRNTGVKVFHFLSRSK